MTAPNPGTELPLGVTKQPTSRPQDSSPGAQRPPRGRSHLTKTDTPRGSEPPPRDATEEQMTPGDGHRVAQSGKHTLTWSGGTPFEKLL